MLFFITSTAYAEWIKFGETTTSEYSVMPDFVIE